MAFQLLSFYPVLAKLKQHLKHLIKLRNRLLIILNGPTNLSPLLATDAQERIYEKADWYVLSVSLLMGRKSGTSALKSIQQG